VDEDKGMRIEGLGLPGEGRHPLHSLVQLEVGCVHLCILPEMVAKLLLLFFLNKRKMFFRIA
jgi:hypothetical protein